MSKKYNALLCHSSWDLILKPPSVNIVDNKQALKIKCRANGTIERYKARLMAKRYTQHEALDYMAIFSPIVKHMTIRTTLALIVSRAQSLKQLDVSNNFLHDNLKEEVFMA